MTTQPAPAPDLIAAVEALFADAIRYGIEAETDYYGRGQPEDMITDPAASWAREALALFRSAPTSREAGLDADPDRHYHDDGCPHLPRVPWNNPKVKP